MLFEFIFENKGLLEQKIDKGYKTLDSFSG